MTDLVVTGYSALTVLGQLILLLVIVLAAAGAGRGALDFLSRNALLLLLIVAALGTGGSLFFSEVAGWSPCPLCWYQRIFLYPQVLLLGLALWTKDRTAARGILLLSLVGLAIALLHYGEQVTAALYPAVIDPNAPCDAEGTSCARAPFFHFGYVTIPLMAATAFALNIAGSLLALRRR